MFPYAVRKEYTIQYNTFLLILPEGLFRINLQYVYIIQLRLMIYMFLIYKYQLKITTSNNN